MNLVQQGSQIWQCIESTARFRKSRESNPTPASPAFALLHYQAFRLPGYLQFSWHLDLWLGHAVGGCE